MKNLTAVRIIIPDQVIPPSDSTVLSQDAIYGQQLTNQYKTVKRTLREIIVLGGMLLQIRAYLESKRPESHPGQSGRYAKGSGLEPWLEQFAPELPYSTAKRFMDLAEEVIKEFKLGKTFNLSEVLSAEEEQITDQRIRKKRGEILRFLEGKSARQLQLAIGKGQHGAGGGHDRSIEKRKQYTPEEQEELFLRACREEVEGIARRLDSIGLKYASPNINDAERDALADLCERVAKQCRTYNATPKNRRRPMSGKQAFAEPEE